MSWAGTVQLNPGRMVYFGTLGEIPMHSSIALGLVLLVSGRAELHDEHGRSVLLGAGGPTAAVLPAGVPHAKPNPVAGATEQAEAVLAVVDPDSPAGRVLTARLAAVGADKPGPDAWVAAARPCAGPPCRPEPDDPAGARLVEAAVTRLAASDPRPVREIHPALRRATALIPARLAGGGELRELAAEVGLSPSRLGHLFAVDLGLPYRAYVRWARLQKVVDVLRGGGTLTEAAHAAGFTDSAHMNRVCRQVFGINPSELIRHLHWV